MPSFRSNFLRKLFDWDLGNRLVYFNSGFFGTKNFIVFGDSIVPEQIPNEFQVLQGVDAEKVSHAFRQNMKKFYMHSAVLDEEYREIEDKEGVEIILRRVVTEEGHKAYFRGEKLTFINSVFNKDQLEYKIAKVIFDGLVQKKLEPYIFVMREGTCLAQMASLTLEYNGT